MIPRINKISKDEDEDMRTIGQNGLLRIMKQMKNIENHMYLNIVEVM
jgi:hypothetical protein